ncbi:uncharacterized protein [Linepithema humile]|uniref:uncharacterized protein isoform X2 n=1 Tax=Linepithema humile TaxID=83485 RepID=UPI00351DE6A1
MLENCRWLLYASRLYGCHPHTIDERSRLANFRLLIAYSLVACTIYCSIAYYMSIAINCIARNMMIVGCVLQQINRYSRSFYMILTPLLSCLRHTEFERAVAAARKFDDLTRHHRWRIDHGRINRRYVQWLVILVILVGWILLSVLAKFAVPQMISRSIVIQCTMRAIFSVEIAKFCFLYDALRYRFCRLNRLCLRLTGVEIGVDTGISAIHSERLTISSIQRLHQCLTDATNYLNSYYSLQLLCWIACICTDVVTFVFDALYGTNSVARVYAQCIILLYLSLQVIAISCVCHLTCDQANALAGTVFSVEASAFKQTESTTEAIELGVFFRTHPLCVKVCGLFNLDNRFVFSAFGVILMYVVLASSIH